MSPASIGPLLVPPDKTRSEQFKHVARQFEGLFMHQMISAMRNTVNKSGFIPESTGEKIYQSMLDSEYARVISETDQMGLSKIVYDYLVRTAVQK